MRLFPLLRRPYHHQHLVIHWIRISPRMVLVQEIRCAILLKMSKLVTKSTICEGQRWYVVGQGIHFHHFYHLAASTATGSPTSEVIFGAHGAQKCTQSSSVCSIIVLALSRKWRCNWKGSVCLNGRQKFPIVGPRPPDFQSAHLFCGVQLRHVAPSLREKRHRRSKNIFV